MPVFQRGGSIIPYKFRFRRSSTQMADDPFTLLVALDKNVCLFIKFIFIFFYLIYSLE
jgi:alpha-glucosidase (family GH31 glycosyl hydrolase)